jgi:drug/metabolite transporter (DMT)-like permease
MTLASLFEMLLLAAMWGASFLFMRMGAGAFGPVAMGGMRVLGAAAFLLPLLLWRREGGALLRHWRPILLVGITNSALPFLCYGAAALAITGGLSSVFNATTPLWGALIAWAWLADKPTPHKLAGLAIGFAGVLWLAWDKASFKADTGAISPGLAVLACLAATAMYGFSGCYTRRYLVGVPSMALACGSQLSASLLLVPLALWQWPATPPGATAWAAVLALAVVCTGVAYVLYFRLIARIGAPNAMSVTFLIPAFAVLWGWMFLNEAVNATMVAACGVILVGTGLVTGLIKPRQLRG